MDTSRTIADLCRRYGVPRTFGDRLRPLLDRARRANPRVRRRLYRMIQQSFEQEARRLRSTMSPRDLPPADWKVVKTVAAVLHSWQPPTWLLLWEEAQRRKKT